MTLRLLPPDKRERRGGRGRGRVAVRLVVLGTVPAGATVHAALAPGAASVPAHSSSATLGLIVAFTEMVGLAVRRWGTPHWKNNQLVPWARAEIVSVAWLSFVACFNFAQALNIYLLVGEYGLAWLAYLVIQVRIAKLVGRRSRTYYVRRWKIAGLTVEQWLESFAERSAYFEVLPAFFARRRTWSVYAATVNVVLSGIFVNNGTAAVRHFHDTHRMPALALVEQATAEGRERWHDGKLDGVGLAQRQSEASGIPTVTPPPASAAISWDSLCHHVEPGAGAPSWARSAIKNAFLGPTGPGAIAAGCAAPAKMLQQYPGFVYSVGYGDRGEIRSLAVASLKHPNDDGIVLGDAAVLALKLIALEGPIGTSARLDAAAGDLYVISTEHGDWLFARATKNANYVAVPPLIARRLIREMHTRGSWLWPSVVHGDGFPNASTFRFITATGKTVATVRSSSSAIDGEAERIDTAVLVRKLAPLARSTSANH